MKAMLSIHVASSVKTSSGDGAINTAGRSSMRKCGIAFPAGFGKLGNDWNDRNRYRCRKRMIWRASWYKKGCH